MAASGHSSCSETEPRTRGAAENLDERFGDPGGPDPGEATSSAASASSMRKRAAQSLNPEMGRMGAEDPSTAFSAAPLTTGCVALPAPRVGGGGEHLSIGITPDSTHAAQRPGSRIDYVVTTTAQLLEHLGLDARLDVQAPRLRGVRRE